MSTPKDIKNPPLPASVPLEKREVFRIDLAKKEGEIDKLTAHIHNIFTDLQL
jgi:hypothetical protein